MRDTNSSKVKRSVRITDRNGNLLYDNRPEPFDGPYVELKGLNVWLFISYLSLHWPNHWAIQALKEDVDRGNLRAETLQDLGEEIELTEEDAKELKALMEEQAG